ncbi:MAG: hypothetical protein KDJ20_00740 [Hyphomicrobiales bacterium]|nr:hypothetical protein [Methylobacteriaceae bacterium]MCC2102650.1 hypothetical protein [Hyphomicrobiales bacterium]MCC2106748.1 hypothetical protein [Hyphomicrobiales bacterium]HRY01691.1 hypothetical protein [Beijerinckiaceae bacterium]
MTVTVDDRYARAKKRLAKRADAAVRKQFDSAYGDKADELLNWLFGPKIAVVKAGAAKTSVMKTGVAKTAGAKSGAGKSGSVKVSARPVRRRAG